MDFTTHAPSASTMCLGHHTWGTHIRPVHPKMWSVMSKTASARFYRSSKKSIVPTGSYEFN